MNVYLAVTSDKERAKGLLPAFERVAQIDRFGTHALTDDPDTADMILFVDAHLHPEDWRLRCIRSHPLTRRYPEKTCIYDERDRTWAGLPGVYVSMPRSQFDHTRQRAFGYYTNNMTERLKDALKVTPDLLFSFMGSRSHKLRDPIFRLSHARAHIADTSLFNFFIPSDSPQYLEQMERQKQAFAEVLMRSKFILCPRGGGSSSIRSYEAMAAGRVPVIVSDDWEPPRGPDWESCALRVREGDVEGIPGLLESKEVSFPKMSDAAHQEYRRWFAPDVMFHHLVENCRAALESSRNAPVRKWPTPQYARVGCEHTYFRMRAQIGFARRVLTRRAIG